MLALGARTFCGFHSRPGWCSCKYGSHCRFVHASSQQQQQAKPNPFGFGLGSRQQQQQQSSFRAQFQQQQQQKPNPFGFGVQGSAAAQSRNAPGQAKVCVVWWIHNLFFYGSFSLVEFSLCNDHSFIWLMDLLNQPFQNKWVRDPSAPTKQQEAAQPPAAAHTWVCDSGMLYFWILLDYSLLYVSHQLCEFFCQLLYRSWVLQATDCRGF